MSKASPKHYPATEFQPPEPVREVTLCGFSNSLATPGCRAAGTAYTAAIPQSMIPPVQCQIHDGRGVIGPADGDRRQPRRDDPFGRRLGRSLKRFFGGE